MKSFVVIGCGRFGSSVAKSLYELGNEVMVIDQSEDIINDISKDVTHAIIADVMDENVLYDLGLANFDVAIIAIGSILEASIMATLATKELGIKKVIAKSQSDMHSKILLKLGADKVVYPEQEMGMRLAYNLNSSNILDFIEFSPEYSIIEISAFKDWEGKELMELKLSLTFSITVLAIRRDDDIKVSPGPRYIVSKDDVLIIMGRTQDVEKLEKRFGD